MSWFGWGENKKILDKNGNEVDTAKFYYAYEFWLSFKVLPETVNLPGVELAVRFANSELNMIKFKADKLDYKDVVRHPNASSSGGISNFLKRDERRLSALHHAIHFFGNSLSDGQENTQRFF